MTRFATVMSENKTKIKSGLTFLLTTRGIPMIYYGTEIMMTGNGHPDHGHLRKNFLGGFEGDEMDKFSESGRSETENEIFNYIKKLLNYRKVNPVLSTGKLMQFVPEKGLYVYFRYNDDKSKTYMIVMNTAENSITFSTKRYDEQLKYYSKGKEIISDKLIDDLSENISLKAYESKIIELSK